MFRIEVNSAFMVRDETNIVHDLTLFFILSLIYFFPSIVES
jgi:hypothetical protein